MSEIRLIQGDCLDKMKDIPDGSIDAIITDPPYGINLQPQRKITKAIIGDTLPVTVPLWESFVPECARVSKPDTAHIFFTRWSETPWVIPLLRKHFIVKSAIVWVKNVFGIGYYTRPQWEMALYCWKGKPPRPDKAVSDVWHVKRVHRPIHSCEKPVELMERAISLCTYDKGATVLDPFIGSGTTGVACINTGRNFIGIELDEKYFNIAQNRIEEAKKNIKFSLKN